MTKKPPVKSYCGGKPNYCTPDPHVDAVNISQERVDETAKRKHEWKGLDGEKFAELVRADEREACAKLVEADGLARGNEGLVLIKVAGRIRARGEK